MEYHDSATPSRAVRAGAQLLDTRRPDWRSRITAPVDTGSFTGCPLGQIYGHFNLGMAILFPDESYHRLHAYNHFWVAAERHGFSPVGYPAAYFDELWTAAVFNRPLFVYSESQIAARIEAESWKP